MGEPATRGAEYAQRMGITEGQIVLELGWDEDCDISISEGIEDAIDDDLLSDPDTDELVDVVLFWFREDDGDLVDGLVDAVRPLGEDGRIWLLTPAAGRPDTLDAGSIAESAQLAGLVQTSALRLGSWQGSCLVQRGQRRA